MTLASHLSSPAYQAHVDRGAITVLPVGSTEQHGPHLPLGTDAIIAEGLARRLAAVVDALVVPTVAYGFRSQADTGGGEAFPGCAGVGGAPLSAFLAEIVASLVEGGCTRLVVLNAHYENAWFVADAVEQTRDLAERAGARVLVCRWAPFVSAATLRLIAAATLRLIAPAGAIDWAREHAGIAETSLMLALAPELVGSPPDAARVAPPSPPYQVYPQSRRPPDHDGLLAPAAGASAELGEAIIRDVVEGLAQAARFELDARPGERAAW